MAEKKLKIGIIGTGSIAGTHINAYIDHIRKYGDIEFVAGCDVVPGRARRFLDDSDMFDARDYLSAEEMLEKEELDGVSVCTYNRQHAAPTIAALKHGVNVLVEKPFAVTLDECIDMMRAEKESGKILTVGFQPRFERNMQLIKQIVQSGELGRVYYIQTGGGRRRGIPGGSFIEQRTAGIGAIGDIGCYSLDMVLNAIGYPTPLTASGFMTGYIGCDPEAYDGADRFDVDDFSGGLVRLEGDVILDFRISWALNVDTPGDTLILGTKAGLRVPSSDCWSDAPGGPMTLYWQCAGQSVQTTIPVINDPNGDWRGLWNRKIDSFLRAIREGGPAPVPTSQIIKNQAIIDGLVRSSKLGREVEIHIPEV